VASIIERIDLGCASNLMRVLISLTAPLILIIFFCGRAVVRRYQVKYCSKGFFRGFK